MLGIASPAPRRAVVVLLLAVLCLGSLISAQSTQNTTSLKVSVSLVDSDLNVKSVPRHVLIIRKMDGTQAARVVTGVDGKAETALDPGTYSLESERPVEFQSKSYRWKQTLSLAAGETKTVELSSDSATVESIGNSTKAAADLPSLFKEWQGSVVTVWSDTGHGSGFVVDSRGLVATNQHVVADSEYAAVQFSETVKVPATVVSKSADKDVAILRVNPKYLADVRPVTLGYSVDGRLPATEGQQVFTIGSPLNQRKVMTSGIVSKIEPKVIISDVNINHGNSGGPLFTLDGLVIGITTFGDFSSQGGPGISGIVRIDEARASVAEAEKLLTNPAPPELTLPVEPTSAFPIDRLKDAIGTKPIKTNEYVLGSSDFDVTFITPVLTYGLQVEQEKAALAEKAKRNKKPESVQRPADPFAEYKNWAEYVGEFRAVVIIDARPKLVEGFWSGLSRGLAASQGYYGGPARLHFKSDFYRMKLYCGDHEVTPIHPGKVEHRVAVSNTAVKVNDVTYEGFYTFSPDAISPSCGQVRLELSTEKEPDKADVRTLSAKMVQKIWDDFGQYRAAQGK